MDPAAFLAIDLGAGSGRAIVGVLDGDRLDLTEQYRFEQRPVERATGLHWDFPRLRAEVMEGTRRAARWCREQRLSLRSLGVDSWGVDYGLLDAEGHLLEDPHAYRDPRNEAAFDATLQQISRDELYAATGIQFMPLNTLFQLVAEQRSGSGLLERAARLLFIPDLLHHAFTGRPAIEATIASTSQMLDPRSGAWAAELLERLRIPGRLLSPPVAPGTVLGPLQPAVRAEIGADPGLQVVAPAGHDTACAVAAVPASGDRTWCYLSSGTWSLLGAELEAPCLDAAAGAVPFTNEGGIQGTTRFLKNITGLWMVQECRRAFEAAGERWTYEELTLAAAAAPPFQTLVDPGHAPFLQPGDMPAKIRAFARRSKQVEPRTPGALVRCCLESLALSYRQTLRQLEAVLQRSFAVVHIVGGGGRNRLLDQMAADATGREVVVGPDEATARGNLLVQALGLGMVRDRHHLREIVRRSEAVQEFHPRRPEDWEEPWKRLLCLQEGTRR